MALSIWTQSSNYSFGTFQERAKIVIPETLATPSEWSNSITYAEGDNVAYNGQVYTCTKTNLEITPGTNTIYWASYIQLPVENDAGVSYAVISGQLPPGLSLGSATFSGSTKWFIIGTPYEVPRITDFKFCIRGSRSGEISDRTFIITVDGVDQPKFVTPEGQLDINPNGQFFTLDSSYVDYQIEVIDEDIATGQHLSFFIADDEGQLPPGLVLTEDGRIVGFVQPALSIKPEDGSGTYDDGYYDGIAYDFGFRPTNGYDSYVYDAVTYDYNLPTTRPKKLNKNYTFIVTVTDGDAVVKREFSIFVVGDDYFRADNTYWLTGTGLFTADATYLRAPIWLTRQDLGVVRANNYVTLVLDVYDADTVFYQLEPVNAEVRAVTSRKLLSDNIAGSNSLTITKTSAVPVIGQWLSFNNTINATQWIKNKSYKVGDLAKTNDQVYRCIRAHKSFDNFEGFEIDLASGYWEFYGAGEKYQVSLVTSLGGGDYRLTLASALLITVPNDSIFYLGSISTLPTGMSFDPQSGEVYGSVPYQPAISKPFSFTVTAYKISDKGEFARSPRVFTVTLLGEIDSVITWVSPADLGTINANFISTLKLEATTTISNAVLLYTVKSGKLPPGLTLDLSGEIVGKVNQYATATNDGLTTFDFGTSVTTFDSDTTTFDRVFTFTVEVRDQLGYSASTKTFSITIDTPNQLIYSNIRTKPFFKHSQREMWKDFINDSAIFTPANIYRPNDTNFGVQTEMSMLVYAGVETKEAAAYISAIGLNHKRKRFQFGAVKKAIAYLPGTYTPVYEVVYIQMVDPLEPNGKRLPNRITTPNRQVEPITIDSSTEIWQAGFAQNDPNKAQKISDLERPLVNSVRPDPIITIDSQGYRISDPNAGDYFPNSITNWRERIRTVGAKERNYLPLWMRSIQPGSKQELDFQLAVPLCYCKTGGADDIILNIKFSGFDFKLLDYTADRYIIDSVEGETADKYLVFRNDRITV